MNDEFLNINDDIKTETEDFIKKLEKIKININTNIPVDQPVDGKNDETDSDFVTLNNLIETGKKLYELYKDISKNIPIHVDPGPSPFPGGPYTPTTFPTGAVVGQVAEKVAPLVVRQLPATLAKSATVAIPYVGQIVTGLSILYEIFKDKEGDISSAVAAANEREKLRLEAEEQAKQTLRQNCEFMAEDLKDDLILSVNETIRDTLGEVERTFTSQIATSKAGARNLTADVNSISDVINNLNRIRVELEA